MRAFIVRPFGTQEGIDFERVEADLIRPALAALGALGFEVEGGTTGQISRQGNIREDMFRLLVVSDLVIADVSIHNANAFYELGIRHALRAQHTFLMRSQTQHAYPFDLQTDRYFLYDAADPGAKVGELARALQSTLASGGRDSPVFQLLPGLQPHDRSVLVKVPADFGEAVQRAQQRARHPAERDRSLGELRLLAQEVSSFDWDQEGLRLIGRAQFNLRAFAGARETFEALRAAAPGDLKVNLSLGTIYQRLTLTEPAERREDLLAQSDQAIRRALAAAPGPQDRAEAYSLLGSNAKTRWFGELGAAAPDARAAHALRSVHFEDMLGFYLKAASQDLNAHYPAVNALALLRAQLALARRMPEVWLETHDDEQKAAAALKARETLAGRLECSLALALELDEVMGKREGATPDPWASSSRADLLLFTASGKPQRVAQEYRRAIQGAHRFALEATRRNLALFKALELFEPNLSAALAVVDEAIVQADAAQPAPARVLLFTGHMVDAPDRPAERARFPRTAKAEQTARRLIESAVRAEAEHAGGALLGVAGGASGGDILFHEVCEALGVPTQLFLALPRDQFQAKSVHDAGPGWVERYGRLCERMVPHVLQDAEALPNWLADKRDYDVWQRSNLWMMFSALATGARQRTLIALYNPDSESDGPGGTKHLVGEARRWGFKSVALDARELLVE